MRAIHGDEHGRGGRAIERPGDRRRDHRLHRHFKWIRQCTAMHASRRREWIRRLKNVKIIHDYPDFQGIYREIRGPSIENRRGMRLRDCDEIRPLRTPTILAVLDGGRRGERQRRRHDERVPEGIRHWQRQRVAVWPGMRALARPGVALANRDVLQLVNALKEQHA